MRAVNLVPGDQRRGGSGGGPSTPTYVLLAALTAIVVAVAAYALTTNSINSRKGQLSKVNADATATEQQAAALRPYRDFADLREARVQTVASLAASRFDWERVMSDLSRALPDDVWLTSLTGTIAPGVTLDGGGSSSSDTGALRSAVQTPAVEILGCTESQSEVSRVMARLRLLHGVTRVSLAASEKNDAETSGTSAGGASSAAGGGSSDCRNGSSHFPQFQLVVFFKGPATPAGAGGATPNGAASAPASPTPPVTTPTATGGGK